MKKNKRFITVFSEGNALSLAKTILVDKETGAHYLLVQCGDSTAITPLIGSDAKPFVTPVRPDYDDYGEDDE